MWSKQTPSQNSSQNNEDLSNFLSNDDFRKLYNKTLGCNKKYQNAVANNWFLQECIKNEIVPRTFRISNQPHTKSSAFSARWTNASKIASIEWIKITLEEDLKHEKKMLDDLTSSFNVLSILAPNDKIK